MLDSYGNEFKIQFYAIDRYLRNTKLHKNDEDNVLHWSSITGGGNPYETFHS